MMKCGHSANATYKDDEGVDQPVCVICAPNENAYTVSDAPDLTDRVAVCYSCRKNMVPSKLTLAFFEHRPTEAYDCYYCGCWGWD